MSPYKFFSSFIFVLNLLVLVSNRVNAQIQPDSTLGIESSTVRSNQTVKGVTSDVISGGAVRGSNLFHSFEKFNINSGQGAYFATPSGITNILTRITGNNPSKIFGILGVIGNANLFLLNPNGIIFGPNARLNLNGSFLATTATSINLSDNSVFSATKPQFVPLLTINEPIGLNFSGNPGSIQVQGTGHNLIQPPSLVAPIIGFGPILPGLEAQVGHALALIGGDVTFTGGIVTAPSGRIEIGSVTSGQVSIKPNLLEGFSLSYEGVKSFQDVLFSKQSLLNASGIFGGDVQIVGRNVKFTDSSLAFIENRGSNSLGAINVSASNYFSINGITNFSKNYPNFITIPDGLISQALFDGKGADIKVSAKHFVLQDSGQITLANHGFGNGGNLDITASDSAEILGKSPFAALSYPFSSIVQTLSAGVGNSGKIVLTAGQLSIQGGGKLLSTTFGNGAAGEIVANAPSIILSGFNPTSFDPSTISSNTLNVGNSGNVFVNTNQLILKNGAEVNTSTLASGLAGNVVINSTDFTDISGIVPNTSNPSSILSSAQIVDKSSQAVLGIPQIPTGQSGNTTINTGRLSITDAAQVTVRNDGTGKAGNLQINANYINLNNHGGITASTTTGAGGNINLRSTKQLNLDHNSTISATAGGKGKGGNITIDPQQTIISNGSGIAVNSTGTGNAGQLNIFSNNLTLNNGSFLSANTNGGEGGNIFLTARNLQLRHSSLFTAAAQGSGNGGNITINTGTLTALENSRISADAVQGNGGNIQINAQGIFRSPDSPITASSQLGINGTVQINTLEQDSIRDVGILPLVPVDITKLVAQACPANVGPRASRFVALGRGGLPEVPSDTLNTKKGWDDLGSNSSSTNVGSNASDLDSAIPSTEYNDPSLVEAQGWATNFKGKVVLTATSPTFTPDIPWLRPPSCQTH